MDSFITEIPKIEICNLHSCPKLFDFLGEFLQLILDSLLLLAELRNLVSNPLSNMVDDLFIASRYDDGCGNMILTPQCPSQQQSLMN